MMIQEIFLKRAANLRKEFLKTQNKTKDYEKNLKDILSLLDNTSSDLDNYLEKLNNDILKDPEIAKEELLKIFMELETEYNKTSKSVDSLEDTIQSLQKEELNLYRDIKQTYPELSDSQIREEIQQHLNKLKLS